MRGKYNNTELLFADMQSDETVVTILQEQDIRLIFFVAFIGFFSLMAKID